MTGTGQTTNRNVMVGSPVDGWYWPNYKSQCHGKEPCRWVVLAKQQIIAYVPREPQF